MNQNIEIWLHDKTSLKFFFENHLRDRNTKRVPYCLTDNFGIRIDAGLSLKQIIKIAATFATHVCLNEYGCYNRRGAGILISMPDLMNTYQIGDRIYTIRIFPRKKEDSTIAIDDESLIIYVVPGIDSILTTVWRLSSVIRNIVQGWVNRTLCASFNSLYDDPDADPAEKPLLITNSIKAQLQNGA